MIPTGGQKELGWSQPREGIIRFAANIKILDCARLTTRAPDRQLESHPDWEHFSPLSQDGAIVQRFKYAPFGSVLAYIPPIKQTLSVVLPVFHQIHR